MSLGGGHPSNYAHSLKGHTWMGHGILRKCKNCGKIPRGIKKNE